MPIFLWSDFLKTKIDLVYLYENACDVMCDLGDKPEDSAAFKAIMSQTCTYDAASPRKKNFHPVVLPQYIVRTANLTPDEAMVRLATETFRLKTRHFRAPELDGDGNLVLAVKKEGAYFMFFSDKHHYVAMHHAQNPLHSHHFSFVRKERLSPGTTAYAADCAVETYKILEKYRDFVVV